ncbi:TPA: hypothetical protein DCQ44_01370 [Candidatus Taylorbacteria bacterium]|nr:hypothetical protein [Candidatus Taylorbacteria bacterium]
MHTTERKPRILIVDDDLAHFKMMRAVLKVEVYDIVCAHDLASANKLVLESLETNNRFDVALVDYYISEEERGDVFAHRLINIVGDIKVVIATSDFVTAAELTVDVDGKLIKTTDWLHSPDTLVEKLESLLEWKRKSHYSVSHQIKRWIATESMGLGLIDLTFLTAEIIGKKGKHGRIEKIIGTRQSDRRSVVTVVYPEHPGDEVIPISVHSTMGCTQRCKMCVHWHSHRDENGLVVPFIGPLTANEIVAQVYHSFNNSSRLLELFEGNKSKKTIKVNFTGEGDVLCDNLDNAATAIRRLSSIEYPWISSFTITSVGHADRLREYLDKYIDLPRVTHYWSANSLDPAKRDWLMPASKGQSLEELRDLHHEISVKTGRPVTTSFALFPGVNDRDEDVALTAEFFKDWLDVPIKLMPGCPGSLKGYRDITTAEVKAFQRKLFAAGLRNVRFRKIYGTSAYAGCGTTQPVFLVGLSKLGQRGVARRY